MTGLRKIAAWLCGTGLLVTLQPPLAEATPPGSENSEQVQDLFPNLASPTMGGVQFWSDQLVFHQWRIQRNVWTNHYRLLDANNVRRAWGSFAQCRRKLDAHRHNEQLPALKTHVVLVLHGLGRSRGSMEDMYEYLQKRSSGSVLNVGYASTRQSVQQHAESLANVVDNLEGVTEISLVAHSLGNLVIRRYLATLQENPRADPPRIRRIVMLTPPNHGAELAERFRKNTVVQAVWGTAGNEIADWNELQARLAIPRCPFGIIAGGRGTDTGYNPLIKGDDDMVVSVAETRLPGAHDFVVVPVIHTTIMDDKRVQEYTLRFLESGYFLSEEKRSPIPPDAAPDESKDE
jgi:hypothetical protein